MAHVVTNHGIHTLLNQAVSGTFDIRMAVYTNAVAVPAAATVRDWNVMSDVTMTEAAAANYARQDLASVTLTEVDGSDNVTLTAAAPTINSVGSGETWASVVYYLYVDGTAGNDIVLSVDEPAATIATNGGNITLPALSLTIAQA